MNELLKVKNSSYSRYEELLLRRDELNKEAFLYDRAYIREFGDMILEVFRMKIECIRKKKTIEYCQAAINHGRSIDRDRLNEYLLKEMAAFQKQLNDMTEDAENAKKCHTVSEIDLLNIKRIYHRLVKKIHPDINPLTNETPILSDLWQRVQTAYSCNNLKDMQELELLVANALEQLGTGNIEIEIPDIESKITELEEEIIKIRETDPYTYKYLLDDPDAVEEKKCSLTEELNSYTEYSKQLDDILNVLLSDGGSITWRMN